MEQQVWTTDNENSNSSPPLPKRSRKIVKQKPTSNVPPSKKAKGWEPAYYQLCPNSNVLIQNEQINGKGEKGIDIRYYCPLYTLDPESQSNRLVHTKKGIRLTYYQCEKLVKFLKALTPPGPHPPPAPFFQHFELPNTIPTYTLNEDGEFVAADEQQ